MKLVIVESPTKAKTIERYLGKEYKVLASFGHVRDLAAGYNDLGVDVNNNFAPNYVISSKSTKVINQLKTYAAKADEVLLATDPDREGEAISWHLAVILGLDIDKTKRLEFHEVTRKAIQEAIENPRTIDMNLVHSQEARRITDRIIGFKLSNLVQQKLSARSAGRVQSVALQLIVDREREIENFLVETTYHIESTFKHEKEEYNATLVDENNEKINFATEREAAEVLRKLNSSSMKVVDVRVEDKESYSLYPLTTSSLQQEAFNLYRFKASKTMKIAQELYEGVELDTGRVGLITYMRTDSIRLSPKFTFAAREYIINNFGEDYAGVARTQKSDANVQDAHEAIRPTDVNITPESIKDKVGKDEYNLYRLIWYRAVCSLMKPEKYTFIKYTFDNNGQRFYLTSRESIFAGHKELYQRLVKPAKVDTLHLEKNEEVSLKGNSVVRDDTKPPLSYSEASLIKTMEEKGIGRPSTYASTIEALNKSQYIKEENKYLKPTPIAITVNDRLQDYFKNFINVTYTARMESQLDKIAEGQIDELRYLQKTYDDFKAPLENATTIMQKLDITIDEKCPLCGGQLRVSHSKYGEFISCSNYPTCSYTRKKDEVTETEKECPACHEGHLIIRKGKKGSFYGCSRYPKCNYMAPVKKGFFKKKGA